MYINQNFTGHTLYEMHITEMNIVLYSRVSTNDQDVAAQVIELRSYCSRQGWTIISEYTDIISGAKAVRPGLDALLERCAAGGVDAMVVVKLDRLGRSLLNVAMLIKKLDDMGVALICSSQGIDTRKDNPCGRFQLNMLSAVAEFERSLIRERTRAGLAVARSNGKVLGRPSQTLIPASEREAVIKAWLPVRQGGYRRLAALLKCSPMTARKLHQELPLVEQSVSEEVA